MNFASVEFLVFLTGVLALFVVLPGSARRWMLWAASYLFYATWSIPFIGVILLTTSVDYYLSKLITRSDSAQTRKLCLAAGLAVNLLILGWFKYANFFLESGLSLSHWLGGSWQPPHLDILLPLGISFYTFEAISYLIDVYRGEKPAPNWLAYNFFIMYFPHLISGPIIRFQELYPQYREPLVLPSVQRIGRGFRLILLGYLFKVLVADNAAGLVDPVFQYPERFASLSVLLAALGFTVQIYFDFMGYTHIARGVSLLLNIELPLNFNHPYLARNISDFWHRWHISLSRWIRDYLYIPLGGSRVSYERTLMNLVLVMTLAGAWHGAGWTFIAWGAYHGVLLATYHAFRHRVQQQPAWQKLAGQAWYRPASVLVTFVLVMLGWVIFRAESIGQASALFARLLDLPALASQLLAVVMAGNSALVLTLAALLLACFSGPWMVRALERWFSGLPFWLKTEIAIIALFVCWVWATERSVPFIYFQF